MENKQTIAVLGVNGFAGQHICKSLLNAGAIVHGYSRNLPLELQTYSNFKFYELDLQNAASLEGELQYDCVINAAGVVAGVGYNSENHHEMETSNFLLMKCAADLAYEQAKYFIQISSACVYANEVSEGAEESQGFIGEPDPANRGYGIGKRKGEEYTRLLFAGQQRAYTILRPYNLYGPGDNFSDRAHVIPALIDKLFFADQIQVWGSGRQVREFVFVRDLAECVMKISQIQPQGIFNICGGKSHAVSIRNLVYMLEKIVQSGKLIKFNSSGPEGQLNKFGNNHKMLQLGLRTPTQLMDGLQETVLWRLQKLEEQPRRVELQSQKANRESHKNAPDEEMIRHQNG